MTEPRQRFVLELQALPGVDGWRALRRLLKLALRAFGLKCVRVTATEKPL